MINKETLCETNPHNSNNQLTEEDDANGKKKAEASKDNIKKDLLTLTDKELYEKQLFVLQEKILQLEKEKSSLNNAMELLKSSHQTDLYQYYNSI